MYVCICKVVTDRDIREAVERGVCTMRDLRNTLGVATQCGRCAKSAKTCLNQTLLERVESKATPAFA